MPGTIGGAVLVLGGMNRNSYHSILLNSNGFTVYDGVGIIGLTAK